MNDGTSPHLAGSGDVEVHALSSSADKIALFRFLFKSREDVYPWPFESNEWVRGICEKRDLPGMRRRAVSSTSDCSAPAWWMVDEAVSPINHKTAASRTASDALSDVLPTPPYTGTHAAATANGTK
jgi:hypothetical protein